MNIKELVAAVIEETGRPDQEVLIERRVKATIIKTHNAEFFPKDRVEEIIKILEPNTSIKMNLPPRWRKFHTLRPCTIKGVPVDISFKLQDPEDIFEPSGIMATNIYYVAGSGFILKAPKAFEALYSMYYVHPALDSELSSTWITNTYSQVIIDGAAAHIYEKVGYSKLAKAHNNLYTIGLGEIIQNHLIEGGL